MTINQKVLFSTGDQDPSSQASTYSPTNEQDQAGIRWLAGESLMLSTVYCYYEQPWTQIKKDDLADSAFIITL